MPPNTQLEKCPCTSFQLFSRTGTSVKWFSQHKVECFIGKTFTAPARRCWNPASRCCVSSSTICRPAVPSLTSDAEQAPDGPAVIGAGHQWSGIEVNRDCLQLLEQRGLPFRKTEPQKGRFPCLDEEFDEAICIEVPEHIEHPEPFLKEISRIVRHRAIFSVPEHRGHSLLQGLGNCSLAHAGGRPQKFFHPHESPQTPRSPLLARRGFLLR